MTQTSVNYTLCDNVESVQAALPVLQSTSLLAFDCEGNSLGRLGGSLSLMTFRTLSSRDRKTYLFDALKLPAESLRPVYALLESEDIRKIVFDGRMDYSCLLHDHGVQMHNVLDLQLVDIRSRVLRGENEWSSHMRRLGTLVSHNQALGFSREQCMCLHRLLGMRGCAQEHNIPVPAEGSHVDHSTWLISPISAQNLSYAANDVLIIELMLTAFFNADYLYNELLSESMRYVSVWADQQPVRGDRYRSHPLLPLNILDSPEIHVGKPHLQCQGCRRMLPKTCYQAEAWNGSRRLCLVCATVDANNLGLGAGSRGRGRGLGFRW